jgi:5'-deoxynucleotidase YfbR-like HD superfamily hydrolase
MARLTGVYEDALVYALHVHGSDVRKGTEIPYVSHLLAVSALVLEHGGDEEEAIAALLHDAAEDHGGERRLLDIGARFSARVADIVRACSDSLAEEGTEKEKYLPRKRQYIRHLWARVIDPTTDPAYLLVTIADKLHNTHAIASDVSAIGDELYDRFIKLHEGDDAAFAKLKTHAYYCDLLRCFREVKVEACCAMVHSMELAVAEFTEGVERSLFSVIKPYEVPPWGDTTPTGAERIAERAARRQVTSRDAVLRAVRECEHLGEEAFLVEYGFGPAQEYVLVVDGRRYPSKAIYGVAHGYEYPQIGTLNSHEFSGGRYAAAKWLAELGFEILRLSASDCPPGTSESE